MTLQVDLQNRPSRFWSLAHAREISSTFSLAPLIHRGWTPNHAGIFHPHPLLNHLKPACRNAPKGCVMPEAGITSSRFPGICARIFLVLFFPRPDSNPMQSVFCPMLARQCNTDSWMSPFNPCSSGREPLGRRETVNSSRYDELLGVGLIASPVWVNAREIIFALIRGSSLAISPVLDSPSNKRKRLAPWDRCRGMP